MILPQFYTDSKQGSIASSHIEPESSLKLYIKIGCRDVVSCVRATSYPRILPRQNVTAYMRSLLDHPRSMSALKPMHLISSEDVFTCNRIRIFKGEPRPESLVTCQMHLC